MTRRKDAMYAGARGRTDLVRASGLGPRYVVQPKLDGCYCVVTTDAQGEVNAMITRSMRPIDLATRDDFRGVRWLPDSVVVAELEAHTEAGIRCSLRRGFRLAHVFDCLRVCGRDVSRLPYARRRDELLRAVVELELEDLDKPWHQDRAGYAHDDAGRFTRKVPMGWRRFPVVPQMPAHQAERAWAEWVGQGELAVEGLVAVALDAPLSGWRSKLKIKVAETIDATVFSVDDRAASLLWAGHLFTVGVGKKQLRPGQVVEVACDGFYESSPTPRFPRVVRVREDLGGPNASIQG